MEPLNSPWSEFATTLFAEQDAKRRHAFLVQNALSFLHASEVPVVIHRFAQCAIPEVADLSLIVLNDEERTQGELSLAYRYPEDGQSIDSVRSAARSPELATLFGRIGEDQVGRSLIESELATLQNLMPKIHLHSAIICRMGSPASPLGHGLFLMTRSSRATSDARTRVVRDLTAFVSPAIERANGAEFLKREIELREKMISIASHELKTPLTAMKLQLDHLRKNLAPSRQVDLTFATVDLTIQKLSTSVSMLFSLAELKSGHMTLVKEPADLAQVLRDLAQRLEPLLTQRKCAIVLEIPETVPGFFDARRIEQGVTNLLANAAKYAPGCEVRLSLGSEDRWAQITVRDKGPGIPEHEKVRIFEAFKRATTGAANTTGIKEGLGLGLYVARGVAQEHGGRLSLVSGGGDGAHFLMEFPLWLS